MNSSPSLTARLLSFIHIAKDILYPQEALKPQNNYEHTLVPTMHHPLEEEILKKEFDFF